MFSVFCKKASGKWQRVSVMEACTIILSTAEFVCIDVSFVNCLHLPNIGSIESTKPLCAGRPANHTVVFDCTIFRRVCLRSELLCVGL